MPGSRVKSFLKKFQKALDKGAGVWYNNWVACSGGARLVIEN